MYRNISIFDQKFDPNRLLSPTLGGIEIDRDPSFGTTFWWVKWRHWLVKRFKTCQNGVPQIQKSFTTTYKNHWFSLIFKDFQGFWFLVIPIWARLGSFSQLVFFIFSSKSGLVKAESWADWSGAGAGNMCSRWRCSSYPSVNWNTSGPLFGTTFEQADGAVQVENSQKRLIWEVLKNQ